MLQDLRFALIAVVLASFAAMSAANSAGAQDNSESEHGKKIELPGNPFSILLGKKNDGVATLEWQELMPPEGQGTVVKLNAETAERKGAPTPEEFSDISPEEFKLALQDIGDMRTVQPQGAAIRTDLDGQKIRLAGYITPVGFDDTKITEFLLVPYVGACIHVPPPPANQIVYVDKVKGVDMEQMWSPVWVTGTLRATPVATVLADVGYSMQQVTVEPYE